MFRIHNLINLGFPLYLMLFEVLLRSLSSVDTSTFIPPTLAASGLGLLIGTIKPKSVKLDNDLEEKMKEKGISMVARSTKDDKLIQIAWLFILLEILTWYWCCAMTLKGEGNGLSKSNLPLIVGIGNYVVGIIISSFKENGK
jgi:hypothetical protein